MKPRYDATRAIHWWDQTVLQGSTVLLCGVGAAGNEVAKNLTMLGVGRLVLVDLDTIEPANLFGSVLFRQSDVGRRKVDVAATALRVLNPDVEVVPLHGDVLWEVPEAAFFDANVVVAALDSWEGRWQVNRLCLDTATPWVDGGLDVLGGRVRSFLQGHTGCLECTFDRRHYAQLTARLGCGALAARAPMRRVPTTPASASIVGGLMAQEAVKLLHGVDTTLGRNLHIEGNFSVLVTDIEPDPDCRADCTLPPPEWLDWSPDPGAPLQTELRKLLGEDARASLYYRLVHRLVCVPCGQETTVLCPEPALRGTGSLCPRCGERCRGDTIDSLEPGDSSGRLTLQQLGLGPGRALRIRRGPDDRGVVALWR